jgi:hypothetical protein
MRVFTSSEWLQVLIAGLESDDRVAAGLNLRLLTVLHVGRPGHEQHGLVLDVISVQNEAEHSKVVGSMFSLGKLT